MVRWRVSPRQSGRSRAAACAGAICAGVVLLSTAAAASPATLTRGHAYCFYFFGHPQGGMHLVAAGPRVISAGPSDYISGVGGKPQDTVVYVDCVDRAGNADGSAYVGLPRVVLKLSGGHFAFGEHVVDHIRRLDSTDTSPLTVSVTLTGAVTAGSSSTGAIRGVLRVAAPGCLARPFASAYTGT
ncbi:MAG TPA: hypothetical protein VND23_04375 [Acidimicrobiales bacterium]|nr:hypothetical protein [Acidimicrobiales bacterium]